MKWEINALPALHALTPWCKTVKIRMLVGDSAPGNIWGPVNGGTEGPELGVEAPRGCSLGRRHSPPRHEGLGAMPPENFATINVEIAYFSEFLRAEMVSSVVASRED